jgi:predicted ester cyclase
MSIEQNKAFVRRYIEAISGKVKTPALVSEFVADEHLKRHIADFEVGFPRYVLTIEDILAEGDKVVIRSLFRGVHQGMFMGRAPTGKKIEVPLMLIYRIADGKIVDHWMQADTLKLAQSLGAVPAAA